MVRSACSSSSSSCESCGESGVGIRPISQLRRLRLRERKEIVPGPTVRGEAGPTSDKPATPRIWRPKGKQRDFPIAG